MENKPTEKLKQMISNDRVRRMIIIAGIVGIALIFISTYVDFDVGNAKPEEEFSVTTYSI